MRRTYLVTLPSLFLAAGSALTIGCGGGGGIVIPPDFSFMRVELPGRDALNLTIGDNVQFVLAGYDANFNRFVVTATSWSLSNVSGAPGILEADGRFSATGLGSARVNATYPNEAVTPLDLVVRPVQARISGRVRNESTTAGVANVIVVFYDNANTEVGRARTMGDGTFLASVPTSTTRVNLDKLQLPAGYYFEWLYRTIRYSANILDCHATIVLNIPLAIGQTSNMPDAIFISPTTDPPPPPPNGCT